MARYKVLYQWVTRIPAEQVVWADSEDEARQKLLASSTPDYEVVIDRVDEMERGFKNLLED